MGYGTSHFNLPYLTMRVVQKANKYCFIFMQFK